MHFVKILTSPERNPYNTVVQLALNIGGPGTKVITACGSWLTRPSKNAQKVNTVDRENFTVKIILRLRPTVKI